jgi:3-phenylpropionate/trans-cinnamate dioxygenase ferredoxin component
MLCPRTVLATEPDYLPVTPADLPVGGTRCVDVNATPLLVARAQDGTYFAVHRTCSHALLSLEGARVRGSSIVCAHHGARFDLMSGKALGPPAYKGIAAYPTRERDGQIEVCID